MRVLIVDPAGSLRARVRELLEEGSPEVEVREAARLSPDLSELTDVDAVMLDAGEPNGLAVLARARARVPEALLVVLTNGASELHRREYLAHGADCFFDKSREFELAARAVLARSA